MAEIRAQFLLECDEHLAEFESGLLQLKGGSTDWEIVNTIFRAAHSVKGGAATFGMDRLVKFAHDLESILAVCRSRHAFPDPHTLAVLLRAGDVLADFVREARDGSALDEESILLSSQELAATQETSSIGAAGDVDDCDGLNFEPYPVLFEALSVEPTQSWIVRFRPHGEFYATANEPLFLLRELQRLGEIAVTLDDSSVSPLSEIDPTTAQLNWTVLLKTSRTKADIHRAFEFVEDLCDLNIQPEANAPAPTLPNIVATPASTASSGIRMIPATPFSSSIRVDLEKVDRLINLVSELVISEATLAERVMHAGMTVAHAAGITTAFDDLRHLTRDLQEHVMGIRAQPVKVVFQRMPRLVREVEARTGKSVQLVFQGEETEIDRALIEGLTDAITHMVRNAIDHGIEKPEHRMACGKPEQALVRLSAAHRAGRVVIEVSDDGAGIDRDKVCALAVERGMIASADTLSAEDIDNLIFEPGLSTATQVTDLSGRGVGMDVVKRSVLALGGRITVTSMPGAGTSFALSLPLTLAVMDGMMVTVCGQKIVIPLTALLGTIQVQESNIHRLGGTAELLTVHGKHVPMIDLGCVLGYSPRRKLKASCVALLVENDAGERVALLVDDIPEQRQIVIKSIEKNYRRVAGIAAATILGNGTVALILDLNSIIATRKTRSAVEVGETIHA